MEIDPWKKPRGGLKIVETLNGEVYVQDLKKIPIDSFDMIRSKMDEGFKNRSYITTIENKASSKAHLITTIEFKQVTTEDDGSKTEKISKINFIDLAGSENRAAGTEKSNANQSLSTFGTCIYILRD